MGREEEGGEKDSRKEEGEEGKGAEIEWAEYLLRPQRGLIFLLSLLRPHLLCSHISAVDNGRPPLPLAH